MIATLASGIHTRWIQACEEVELAGKRFAWACYAGSPVVPGDTALTVLPCEEMNASLLSTDYLNYFSAQVAEKKGWMRVERSKFFPEISVGYVQQKIAPLQHLNSWMVGVSFPILFFPQRSRARQAKVAFRIAEWEADMDRTRLTTKVDELRSRITQQRKSLDYYDGAALKEAESLQQSALQRFRESETDIAELVQSLNAAQDIRRSYLETVYNYNVSVLEMELYTE